MFSFRASWIGVLPLFCEISPAFPKDVTLQFATSATEMTTCPGSRLEVSVRLSNPAQREIGGYQVFLRFQAKFFEAVKYEPMALDAFLDVGGPVPLGEGYRPCTGTVSDPWSDGAGDDVASVVATIFGNGSTQPFREKSDELGRFKIGRASCRERVYVLV